MTKSEFYLRAMLSLAANPKYVEMAKDEDDPNEEFPALLDEIIETDAEALLKTAETWWPEAFDKEDDVKDSTNSILTEIRDKLDGIRDSLDGNLSVIVEEA